jgi:TPR repeat protein
MRIFGILNKISISILVMSSLLIIAGTPAFASPKDDFENTQKQAEAGNPEAQFTMGQYYERGDNFDPEVMKSRAHEDYFVPQDYKKAHNWYLMSAKQGHAAAQYHLAMLYHQGWFGIKQNHKKAYAWASLASAQKYVAGTMVRDRMNEDLDPETVKEGKRLANAYYKKYVLPFRKKKAD